MTVEETRPNTSVASSPTTPTPSAVDTNTTPVGDLQSTDDVQDQTEGFDASSDAAKPDVDGDSDSDNGGYYRGMNYSDEEWEIQEECECADHYGYDEDGDVAYHDEDCPDVRREEDGWGCSPNICDCHEFVNGQDVEED